MTHSLAMLTAHSSCCPFFKHTARLIGTEAQLASLFAYALFSCKLECTWTHRSSGTLIDVCICCRLPPHCGEFSFDPFKLRRQLIDLDVPVLMYELIGLSLQCGQDETIILWNPHGMNPWWHETPMAWNPHGMEPSWHETLVAWKPHVMMLWTPHPMKQSSYETIIIL